MPTNLDKYRQDLDSLLERGKRLLYGMLIETKHPQSKDLSENDRKAALDVRSNYQSWYSEALSCISELLPDRVDDFILCYKSNRPRKDVTRRNYNISDYLQGLIITRQFGKEIIVAPVAALAVFYQQTKIVESVRRRFESSPFDIRALVQADLFGNELEAAEALNKAGYPRGAGAIAGVVLEAHLETVCQNHTLAVPRNPTISKLNNLLKDNGVIEIPDWRFIKHLGDVRNLCDHRKSVEPNLTEIGELIVGVRKITKTIV